MDFTNYWNARLAEVGAFRDELEDMLTTEQSSPARRRERAGKI